MRLKAVATLHIKNKVKEKQPIVSGLVVVNSSDPLSLKSWQLSNKYPSINL